MRKSEVVLFHDETVVKGSHGTLKGHVLLFVPVHLTVRTDTPLLGSKEFDIEPWSQVLDHLNKIRGDFGLRRRKLHFKELSGRRWTQWDQGHVEAVRLLVEALRSRGSVRFQPGICLKLAVMVYPELSVRGLFAGDRKEQRLRHEETILRMLIKGAAHHLYNHDHEVVIRKIICDGEPSHRRFDERRVLEQLEAEEARGRTPLRSYVKIAPGAVLTHLNSRPSAHEPGSREARAAELLQLADLALGSVREACFGSATEMSMPKIGDMVDAKRPIVARPVREMLKKQSRGSGLKNSGHYRSFHVCRIEFSGDSALFHDLDVETTSDLQTEFDLEC